MVLMLTDLKSHVEPRVLYYMKFPDLSKQMNGKWFHIIYKLIELNIVRNLRKICIQKDLLIFGINFYILTDQLRCFFYILYYSRSCSVKLSNRKANKVVCVHGKINNILLS